ncbi:MAG: hypothetical protein RL030_527, partial [Pseudomonadota bacterium]
MTEFVVALRDVGRDDVAHVGGKNASLGEMLRSLSQLGVDVPDGFATTADAYRAFAGQKELDERIHAALDGLDVDDIEQLTQTGARIRQWIIETPLP